MSLTQQAFATSMDSKEVLDNISFCASPKDSNQELPCLSENIPNKPLTIGCNASLDFGDEKPKVKKHLRTKSRPSYVKDVNVIPTRAQREDDGLSKVPHAARLALEALGDPDESILLLDLGQVSKKLEEWRSHLPRVHPHYAVKCNPDKKMVRLLKDGHCGFDCATLAEISTVLKIGGSPEDIIFAHPCKPRSHIRFAKEHGVKHMTFDNAAELHKIASEFAEAKVLLRLVCEDTHAQCPMSMKFGARREDWEPLLETAANLKLHMVGISFHVGSGCKEPGAFQKALRDASDVFALAKEKGFVMEILDIGGGFPGVDTPEIKFADLASGISKDLSTLFPEADWPQLRIIAEPGRFFAHSAAALLTKVISRAEVSDGQTPEERSFRYYLNDGLYGSFNCVIFDHAEVTPEVLDPSRGPQRRCCVFGPTCDGFDMIIKETQLPELNEGDWLLWRDMGAYTSAAASKFNGFPDAKVWYYAEKGSLPGI